MKKNENTMKNTMKKNVGKKRWKNTLEIYRKFSKFSNDEKFSKKTSTTNISMPTSITPTKISRIP